MTLSERLLRTLLLSALLTVGIGGVLHAQADDEPLPLRALPHEDRTRSYLLHIPQSYTDDAPAPLVLVFHGSGGNADDMVTATEFRDLANDTGTIVVYPNAVNGRWDYLDVPIDRGGTVVDDVGFVALLIDELAESYNIDDNRIYTVGYSNGALMAFRARCTLDDRIAATGLVGMSITTQLAQGCVGSAPVATVWAIGTNDPVFPLNGYAEIENDILYSAFSHTMTFSYLTTLNNCDLTTGRFEEITGAESPHRVVVQEPAGCPDDDLVRFYAIAEAGHVWPRAIIELDDSDVDTIPADMWAFLHARSRD